MLEGFGTNLVLVVDVYEIEAYFIWALLFYTFFTIICLQLGWWIRAKRKELSVFADCLQTNYFRHLLDATTSTTAERNITHLNEAASAKNPACWRGTDMIWCYRFNNAACVVLIRYDATRHCTWLQHTMVVRTTPKTSKKVYVYCSFFLLIFGSRSGDWAIFLTSNLDSMWNFLPTTGWMV